MSLDAGRDRARRCVVVDDHHEMAAAIAVALEAAGYCVVGTAFSGDDGMREIESTQPAFAVVDLQLPDTTGIELAARLRAVAPETHLVLHTAFVGPSTVADALASGMQAVVLKGNVSCLLDALLEVRQGEVYIDPAVAPAGR